jgi:DNA-binding CsgD family transcriptional regulator
VRPSSAPGEADREECIRRWQTTERACFGRWRPPSSRPLPILCASTYEAARSLGRLSPALARCRDVAAYQALKGPPKAEALSALARAYRQLRRRRRPLLGSRRPAPLPSPAYHRRRRQLAEGALYLCALLLRGSLLFLAKDRYDRGGRLIPGREAGELLQALSEEAARGVPVLVSAVATRARTARRGERRQLELESAWSLARAVLDSPGERPDPLLLSRLQGALSQLSPQERRVADLLLEDLDPADIAARLEVSLAAAQKAAQRVRARLAALLSR